MTDLVIETSGLRKVYRSGGRRTVAVDGLDLSVPAGGVHGFLGPNGSGKTTTIKMLLGLTRPSGGEMRLFGLQVPAQLPQVIDRVGAIVEEPRFTPTFSGRKNLSLLARSIGVPRSTVDEVLQQAGLADRAKEKYGTYSLGMKQRLAIAAALLKNPDLLILDEPTNGLDPAGIRGIRDLIRDLGESGVTVLLSSHILAEVQQVCHSVSIVGEGKLLASGRVEDLLGENVSRTRVGVTDPQGARHFLEAAGYTVAREGDLLVVEGHENPEEITKLLAGKGVYVSELSAIRPTLETFFLKLTGRARTEPPPPSDPTDPSDPDATRRRPDAPARRRAQPVPVAPRDRAARAGSGRAGRRPRGRDRLEHPPAQPLRPHRRRGSGGPGGREAGAPPGGARLQGRPEGLPRPVRHGRPVPGRARPRPGGVLPARPAQLPPGAVHLGARPVPGRGRDQPDGDRRLHLRGRRLGVRFADQPAAVRPSPVPCLAGQGRRRDA